MDSSLEPMELWAELYLPADLVDPVLAEAIGVVLKRIRAELSSPSARLKFDLAPLLDSLSPRHGNGKRKRGSRASRSARFVADIS